MTDMGVKYDLSIAEKGVEEGRVEVLKELKDPGRQGTEEAKQMHAFATTSETDPPVEIMGDHHHRNRVTKEK
jgi:hypothetical protein